MGSHNLKCKTIQTEIFHNIRFFNAGIRKQTESICQPHFIEYITQSLLYSVNLEDAWILIGSDGRVHSKDMIKRIIHVLAGNSVRKVAVGLNAWIPAFAAGCLMRDKFCHFGLVISGGHNPPGDHGYLGLKIISPPGVPVREEITDKANRLAKTLQRYSTCEKLPINFSILGEAKSIIAGKKFSIEVMDVVSPYIEVVKTMFDLPAIKDYIHSDFKLMINCSNGVSGIFVKRIFLDELGIPAESIINADPLEDFGGVSPDPNPTSFKQFVNHVRQEGCQFSAVIDPDGCRCMIIGEEGFIVPPSDSLAIVAAQNHCIPFFRENKLEKVVRTICTSGAVDRVAEMNSLLAFEVPVGWHNFSSAMISAKGKATLFGEESYGLGVSSDSYSGDKDGIWTILAWLSIMSGCKKGVKNILQEHWKSFGRSFFGRLDFLNVPHLSLESFLAFFREKNSLRFEKIKSGTFQCTEYLDPFGIDPKLQTEEAKKRNTEIVFDIENYVYPYGFIKKPLLKDDQFQIYQIYLMEDARLVVRRSESTSSSSTLRFYIEYNVPPDSDIIFDEREVVLEPFIKAAIKITKIEEFISTDISPSFN